MVKTVSESVDKIMRSNADAEKARLMMKQLFSNGLSVQEISRLREVDENLHIATINEQHEADKEEKDRNIAIRKDVFQSQQVKAQLQALDTVYERVSKRMEDSREAIVEIGPITVLSEEEFTSQIISDKAKTTDFMSKVDHGFTPHTEVAQLLRQYRQQLENTALTPEQKKSVEGKVIDIEKHLEAFPFKESLAAGDKVNIVEIKANEVFKATNSDGAELTQTIHCLVNLDRLQKGQPALASEDVKNLLNSPKGNELVKQAAFKAAEALGEDIFFDPSETTAHNIEKFSLYKEEIQVYAEDEIEKIQDDKKANCGCTLKPKDEHKQLTSEQKAADIISNTNLNLQNAPEGVKTALGSGVVAKEPTAEISPSK